MACIASLACRWFVSFAYISTQRKLFANTRIPFFAFILNFIKFCPKKYFKIIIYSVLSVWQSKSYLLYFLLKLRTYHCIICTSFFNNFVILPFCKTTLWRRWTSLWYKHMEFYNWNFLIHWHWPWGHPIDADNFNWGNWTNGWFQKV